MKYSEFYKRTSHYLLINLTSKSLSTNELIQIEQEHSITIDNCYNVTVELPHKDIRLSNVLYGDIYRIHTPIIYVIPSGYCILKDDKWWNYSYRSKDVIYQKSN